MEITTTPIRSTTNCFSCLCLGFDKGYKGTILGSLAKKILGNLANKKKILGWWKLKTKFCNLQCTVTLTSTAGFPAVQLQGEKEGKGGWRLGLGVGVGVIREPKKAGSNRVKNPNKY